MATRYIFEENKYTSLYQLRQAIWKSLRVAYANPKTQEEFDAIPELKGHVTVEEYDPMDDVNDDSLRARALSNLESSFTAYRNSPKTYINSSLGFKANANETAFANIDGCIAQAEAPSGAMTTAEDGKITFMDFEDQPHELTADQLKTLKVEVAANGSRAYGVKWMYRQQIEAADRATLLKGFNFDFRPDDQKTPEAEESAEA